MWLPICVCSCQCAFCRDNLLQRRLWNQAVGTTANDSREGRVFSQCGGIPTPDNPAHLVDQFSDHAVPRAIDGGLHAVVVVLHQLEAVLEPHLLGQGLGQVYGIPCNTHHHCWASLHQSVVGPSRENESICTLVLRHARPKCNASTINFSLVFFRLSLFFTQ